MRDSRGLVYSTTIHAVLLLLLIFGLPDFFHRTVEEEPMAISVDILPMAAVANVKPQEKTPEHVDKKPIADKTTERKATVEAKMAEEQPKEKPEPISAKEIVKKPDKKPDKKPEKKPEKKQDDLASVLKSVESSAKAEESTRPTQQRVVPNQHEAKSQHYDPGLPLSQNEMGIIQQQVGDKWNAPVGAKEAVMVPLHILLNQDGSVASVEFSGDQSRYASDSFYYAAVEAAKRAVHMASPLRNLPPEKYYVKDGWREFYIDFKPPSM